MSQDQIPKRFYRPPPQLFPLSLPSPIPPPRPCAQLPPTAPLLQAFSNPTVRPQGLWQRPQNHAFGGWKGRVLSTPSPPRQSPQDAPSFQVMCVAQMNSRVGSGTFRAAPGRRRHLAVPVWRCSHLLRVGCEKKQGQRAGCEYSRCPEQITQSVLSLASVKMCVSFCCPSKK